MKRSFSFNKILTLFALIASLLVFAPPVYAQTVAATIPISSGDAIAVGVNSSTNRIYVADQAGNTVFVIDGATNSVVAIVPVGQSPIAVGVNSSTNRIYVANRSSDDVSVIDGASNSVIATIPVPPIESNTSTHPGIAVNPATNRVYLSHFSFGYFSVIDGNSNTVITNVPVPGSAVGVGVNPGTDRIYVANLAGNTWVIDGGTNTIIADIPTPLANGVGVNPNTNRIYAANLSNTVSVIDGGTNSIIASLPVSQSHTVAANPASNHIYTVIPFSGTVSVFDGGTNGLITTLPVAAIYGPSSIGVNPNTNRIYVVGVNSVSVIDDFPPFTEDMTASAALADAYYSSTAWGDYDNDGDLDILLTGDTGSGYISVVYRNDGGGVFTDINAGLTGVHYGSTAWGDYDNDGDLDILFTGNTGSGLISVVYRNDGGGVFTDINAGLTGVYLSSTAWGDYDNDGDLDILLTGNTGSGGISVVYRNDGGGAFTDINAGLTWVWVSSTAWGDYDNDGDLDILLTGGTGSGYISVVYRNDGGGVFTDINAGLTGVAAGSIAWGDYDNDGDLDILLTGYTASGGISVVYRNDGAGAFTNINAGLTGVFNSSTTWGDYDNDGDLDIMLTGETGSTRISVVYRNDSGGVFTGINAGLTGVSNSSAAWGDYDNDGDLDILLTGLTQSGGFSAVYRNNSPVANTVPASPANLSVSLSGSSATFSWDASTDNETPQAGLTYNLRIGTTPGGSEVMSAMADASNGYREVVQLGNTNHNTSRTVNLDLQAGVYYWSVQAVDHAFAGSPFAAEKIFFIPFTEDITASAALADVWSGSAAWGDYDNDGDRDILLTGYTGSGFISVVYRNDGGGVFTGINAGLTGVSGSSAAWGDYDNDGDLDILLTGYTGSGGISVVYRNDGGGVFSDINAGLTGVYYSSTAWGDYDNDGDLDILLTGGIGTNVGVSSVYRNDGQSIFTNINAGLTGVRQSSTAWGDYDNDGDLDILLTGDTGSGGFSTVYRNNSPVANSVPTAPANLSVSLSGSGATFSWDASTDNETPQAGLTYNLRIGTTPGGSEVMSAMADAGNGYREVVQLGNTNHNTSRTVNLNFQAGAYYWGVQAVDHAFAGSMFAEDSITSFSATINSVADVPLDDGSQVALQWDASFLDQSPNLLPSYSAWRANSKFGGNSFIWEWLATMPALTQPAYQYTAETLYDSSSVTNGKHYFMVVAHTSDANTFFISDPDSGYSIHNTLSASSQILHPAGNNGSASIRNEFSKGTAGSNGYDGLLSQSSSGVITLAQDVPYDQGGRVFIHWQASELDTNVSTQPYYTIWRSSPGSGALALTTPTRGTPPGRQLKFAKADDVSGDLYQGEITRVTEFNGQQFVWEYLATSPSLKLPMYQYAAPTLYDSSAAGSAVHYFMVVAHTDDPSVFYESDPDSGYSLDNLAPGAPQNLAGQLANGEVALSWDTNLEPDLRQYFLYRSNSPIVDPDLLAPFAMTGGNNFIDNNPLPGDTSYYIVRAEDIHGNLSASSNEVPVFTSGATPVGNDIVVQLTGSTTGASLVTITFANVTQAGTTTLETSSSGQPPPAGFRLGNPPVYYEIATTAIFSPPVIICIDYTGVSYSNEAGLKLRHREGNNWPDRTVSLDTLNNTICAEVTSLSPFIITEPNFEEYVAFATNSIWMQQGADILSGSVGVNDSSAGPFLDSQVELSVGQAVTTPAGFGLKGHRIKVKQNANVASDVFFNELTNNGTISGLLESPLELPLFTELPVFKQAAAGTVNITVEQNESIVLDNTTAYGDITIKKNGVILFTGGGEFITGSINGGANIKLLFDAPTEVLIDGKFDTDENSFVGPLDGSGLVASDIIFYVAGINGNNGNLGATPKAAQLGLGNTVSANFYVPNGTLWLRQGTEASGAFLARDVNIGENVQLSIESAFDKEAAFTEVDPDDNEVLSSVPLPDHFVLEQNYPNPFNPSTTIEFSLPTNAEVTLVIYNVSGQVVERLIDHQSMTPGSHSVEWAPRALPSGVYFYHLTARGPSAGSPQGQAGQGFAQSRKMVLMK